MTKDGLFFMIGTYLVFFIGYWLGRKQESERSWVTAHKDVKNQLEEKDNKIAELEAQIEKMRNCRNCIKNCEGYRNCTLQNLCYWEWDNGDIH